jgi:carbonic anhydrase
LLVYSLTLGILLALAGAATGPFAPGFRRPTRNKSATVTAPEPSLADPNSILASLSTTASAATAAAWGYAGEEGPDHWAELDPTYALCASGLEQSPIDLTPAAIANVTVPTLLVDYSDQAMEVEHNGHTIEALVEHGGVAGINIGTVRYDLVQFHFHTSSEHLVNGKEFPLELHLVHRSKDGALAVLGIFIVAGRKHAELDKIFSRLPKQETDAHFTVEDFNLKQLLPATTYSFRYSGSLTTPACSQGVTWTVLSQPIELSAEQIQAFQAIFSGAEFPHGNRRPVQALNGRGVGFSQIVNFDVCLQDESSKDVLQFSSITGDYKFTRCGSGGFSLAGRGSLFVAGGALQLRSANVAAALTATPFGASSGKAVVRPNAFGASYSITDNNLATNSCSCP